MIDNVRVVIRCADQVWRLLPTLQSILRPGAPVGAVAIVVDSTTPASAREWILSLRDIDHVQVIETAAASPGAAFNAGIRSGTERFLVCLDAGDDLDAACLENLRGALESNATGSTWVTGGGILVNADGTSSRYRGAIADAALAADPDVVSVAMFRRALWDRLGGLDESLAVLERWDFWIRACVGGEPRCAVDAALITRSNREGSLLFRARTSEARDRTVRAIVERHAEFFVPHAADVLAAFSSRALASSSTYQQLIARHHTTRTSIADLEARRSNLQAGLTERDLAVDLGDLDRRSPLSPNWGYERGVPVDRRHIEDFLAAHAADIRGDVLEIQENDYTTRFGGSRVTKSDVLDVTAGNPVATVVADLRHAPNIHSSSYDCVILTQTAHVIDDMRAVLAECARILKPGGVLLATFPAASRVCLEYGRDGDFWRVTEAGVRQLARGVFPADRTDVAAVGNVMTTSAFLYGLAAHELGDDAYGTHDPFHPTLITLRAARPAAPSHISIAPAPADAPRILIYHRVGEPASDVHHLFVRPREFHAQMRMLAREFDVLPLAELVDRLDAGTLGPRSLAVTFDDGYADNLLHASPVLVELGLPATFFVTTAAPDGPFEYWWDTLERVLLVSEDDLPAFFSFDGRTFDTSDAARRLDAYRELYRIVQPAELDARDRLCRALLEWSGAASTDVRNRRLRPDELTELAARPGHDIGAHTVSHLRLTTQSRAVVSDELERSRAALCARLGRTIAAVAYPYGAHDDTTVAAARATGYRLGVTCEARALVRADDRLRLPRIDASQAVDGADLMRRVCLS